MSTELEKISSEFQLVDPKRAKNILTALQIEAAVKEYDSIITSIERVGEDNWGPSNFREAREVRLNLKKVRVAIDKKREELKRPALEEGRLIERIAKELIGPVEAVEKRAAHIEKIEEIREKERQEKLLKERLSSLQDVLAETDVMNLPHTMIQGFSDEEFLDYMSLLMKKEEDAQAKREHDAKERERLEKEAAEEREKNRILQQQMEEQQKAARAAEEATRAQQAAMQAQVAEQQAKAREEAARAAKIEAENAEYKKKAQIAEAIMKSGDDLEIAQLAVKQIIQNIADLPDGKSEWGASFFTKFKNDLTTYLNGTRLVLEKRQQEVDSMKSLTQKK